LDKFEKICWMCGFCDLFYKRKHSPPQWMNKKEKDIWKIGYNVAKEL